MQFEVQAEVSINGVAVPVTAEPSIDVKVALASVPFTRWASTLCPEFSVKQIHLQSVDMFGPRVGFLKLRAFIVDTATGKQVPGIAFLRGGAVAVLVVLECEGEEYTLLTRQPRAPIGIHRFPEIPAGMLDGLGHFAGVAAKEMEEETGIKLDVDDLFNMTEAIYGDRFRGMIPSAGGCDERLHLFAHRRSVTRDELDAMQGRVHGAVDENEHIVLDLVPLADLDLITPDAKALSALTLYRRLRTQGKL
jgi:ADP-sugar diphosphatase